MKRNSLYLILCVVLLFKEGTAQNATNGTSGETNNSSNDSDSSSSSSAENSQDQESSTSLPLLPLPFPLPLTQFTCINNRLVQFLQVGMSFNDNILNCTSSLTNLGTASYNRLTDFNFQFDDLASSYAAYRYCLTGFCRIRESVSLATDISAIAADLNALSDNLSSSSNSSAVQSTTLSPNASPRLNATERICVSRVVDNLTNVFNNLSACTPGSS